MGFLFGRKKEKAKKDVISISGAELCDLLIKAVSLTAEDVEAKSYLTGPEIMFEYNGNIHFIGIQYDKKRAKTEKRVMFSNELMTLYVDKQSFSTMEDLRTQATIDGEFLSNISTGIIVFSEYKELL